MQLPRHKYLLIAAIVIVIIISVIFATVIIFLSQPSTEAVGNNFSSTTSAAISTENPTVIVSTILEGLSNPWDLAFVSEQTFIYTQRGGEIRGFDLQSKEGWSILQPDDVYARGEGGLMSVISDIDFAGNNYIYACMNVAGGVSITVARWELSEDFRTLSGRQNIITDIPANTSGRHSGCRMAMDINGYLWIGTGDTASDGTIPQNPRSLGGKVLRVDRNGQGVAGNMELPFDPRIFSYGHRNTQGIVLFNEPLGDVYGFTSEHGPDRDDEVNLLKKGNFGWDPVPGYNESRSMTDLTKFPDAIPAIWNSGSPTIATSGIVMVQGEQWKAWNGTLLIAAQKGQHVRLQKYDENYQVQRDEQIFSTYGRIRTVVQGLNANLYILTDNGGGQDQVIEISAE